MISSIPACAPDGRLSAEPPWDPVQRLAALNRYAILDTPPEQAFDDLCTIAARVCHAPIAVVNLIAETRQFFKAEIGLGVRETPLDVSICAHAILQRDLFVVPDTTRDARFASNPLVTGKPHLRFYAGALLETPDGFPLGTVCVLDYKTRPEGLTADQAEILRALARQAMTQLEHRRLLVTLAEREAELERVQDLAAVGGLEIDLRAGFKSRRSSQYLRLHGLPADALNDSHEAWVRRLHPEDRIEAERVFLDAVRGGATRYKAEYRIIRASDGEIRWVSAVGDIERDEAGRPLRFVGAHSDITERKRLEEGQALVSRELHHRVQNTLATVQAVISSSARHASDIAEFRKAVTERIASLSKTHSLLVANEMAGASLRDVLLSELQPYEDGSAERVRLVGPEVRLPTELAMAFGMAFHELTTNSAKHGSLSVPGGGVAVRWEVAAADAGRLLQIRWRENGGPTVTPPKRQGFGTTLLQRALGRQVGGEVETDFAPDGLRVRILAHLDGAR